MSVLSHSFGKIFISIFWSRKLIYRLENNLGNFFFGSKILYFLYQTKKTQILVEKKWHDREYLN